MSYAYEASLPVTKAYRWMPTRQNMLSTIFILCEIDLQFGRSVLNPVTEGIPFTPRVLQRANSGERLTFGANNYLFGNSYNWVL